MKSLKIKLPVGQVFFQAVLWLLVFCVAIEAFARTSAGRDFFQYESYGSSHPHFDPQVIRIKAREVQDGQIDCIILGDSQVLYGIDPTIVEQAYFDSTGNTIHCQNFGLGGLKPITAYPLAKLLIKNFHPAIIVFGTDLFDYTAVQAGSDSSIMSSPWVKYQLDDFSVDGWLIENSNSYRFYLGADRYLLNGEENADHIGLNGHSLKFSEKTNMSQQEQVDYFDSLLDRPEITGEQLDGLHELLALYSAETKIVLFETPVDPIFFTLQKFAYNRKVYPDFRNMLENEAAYVNTDLWLTQESIQIPMDGWYDIVHFNKVGSEYFSRLLGEHLSSIQIPISGQIP